MDGSFWLQIRLHGPDERTGRMNVIRVYYASIHE